jgi:AcrR family transcriptional regulator
MAWDTERTRQRLLDAAVREYSEHGPLGARVDRVAERAGINKERIYQYFGNKQKLFSAVLEQEMTKLAAAVPLTEEQAGDLGTFAARVYDYHREYPHYLRLLLWEGLEPDPLQKDPATLAAATERAAHYAENVRLVARAQAAGKLRDDLSPAHLLYAARALAAWWLAIPQAVAVMLGPAGNEKLERRRRALIALVNGATRPMTKLRGATSSRR